jgi:hypothetical protein
MRNLIIIITVTLTSLATNAQDLREKDVPDAVKTKFASLYPDVKAQWEMENGKYEAEFYQNKFETSVLFDAAGTIIQTEREIPVSSLPQAVRDYVKKNLKGQKITEAEEISEADGTVNYEAEVGKSDYIFDSNGNFIKKETDENETEDDDDGRKNH